MTKSQKQMIVRIEKQFHDVKVTENEYCLFVNFTNGEKSIYNQINAMFQIGKRGGVKILSVDRCMTNERKHRKTLGNLLAYELGLRKHSFSKHF